MKDGEAHREGVQERRRKHQKGNGKGKRGLRRELQL